ncbi:MAG: FkbM family methyltransferase [Pseudomonadota bacterium]
MITPPVYVINRAQDTARLERFSDSATGLGLSVTRIEAIDGHDPATPLFLYRHLLRDRFRGGTDIKPGALGCYLSHMAAWRKLISDGHEVALICEDDVVLRTVPPMPDVVADIIFVNDRLQAWRAGIDGGPASVPVSAIISALSGNGQEPGQNGLASAPGADAYLLTRRGAERLLALTAAHGIITGVDWAMIGFSTAASALVNWAEAKGVAEIEEADRLRAVIGAEAIGGVADAAGGSTIGHKTLIAIADCAATPRIKGLPDLPEDPVCTSLAAGRYAEEPALEMMYRWFPKGGTFVDIGAHVGAHSLFMLRHGGAAKAIPFEFHGRAIEGLKHLMGENGLAELVDISHLGLGLTEDTGKRALRGPDKYPYGARLKPDFTEDIKVRAGDSLLRDEAGIAMIKIDVNGDEREVLKGLKKTMKRKRPLLAIDMTAEKSAKARPILTRHFYTEAETAEWAENGITKRFAIFHCDGPPAGVRAAGG